MKKLGLLLVFLAALGAAQERNPFANDKQAVEDGRLLFRLRCASCHGMNGTGGYAPDLTLGTYHVGETDSDLYGIIANGSQGTEMPDFVARFGRENIWRMVSYVRSLARPDAPRVAGDVAAGQAIYAGKGQCATCHVIDGKGGRMGPDLSAAGRMRSPKYLRTSVIDPDAELTPGYATITVVTKDGKKIAGSQRGWSNFSGQLLDVSGNFYSFELSEVKSMQREAKSLMPSYKNLTEKELNDLLAYLVSLGGKRSGGSPARQNEAEGAHNP
jgi:putative heme-binding domain-containing protein